MIASVDERPVRQGRLWLCWTGGGIAWLAHLLLVYIIAEFGCVAGLGEVNFLGMTVVAWLLLAASVITALAAALAAWTAYRWYAPQQREEEDRGTVAGLNNYMARSGIIMNGLFLFVILVQSVPIFFYLHWC